MKKFIYKLNGQMHVDWARDAKDLEIMLEEQGHFNPENDEIEVAEVDGALIPFDAIRLRQGRMDIADYAISTHMKNLIATYGEPQVLTFLETVLKMKKVG